MMKTHMCAPQGKFPLQKASLTGFENFRVQGIAQLLLHRMNIYSVEEKINSVPYQSENIEEKKSIYVGKEKKPHDYPCCVRRNVLPTRGVIGFAHIIQLLPYPKGGGNRNSKDP